MIKSDWEFNHLGMSTKNSHCIDLHLGNQWATMRASPLPLRLDHVKTEDFELHEAEVMILPPLSFCLAVAQEQIDLPTYIASLIMPRSGAARCGLHVEQTMAWPGFAGSLVLEITNLSPRPIVLTHGLSIASLVLIDADEADEAYNGKYQGQTGLTLPIKDKSA